MYAKVTNITSLVLLVHHNAYITVANYVVFYGDLVWYAHGFKLLGVIVTGENTSPNVLRCTWTKIRYCQ